MLIEQWIYSCIQGAFPHAGLVTVDYLAEMLAVHQPPSQQLLAQATPMVPLPHTLLLLPQLPWARRFWSPSLFLSCVHLRHNVAFVVIQGRNLSGLWLGRALLQRYAKPVSSTVVGSRCVQILWSNQWFVILLVLSPSSVFRLIFFTTVVMCLLCWTTIHFQMLLRSRNSVAVMRYCRCGKLAARFKLQMPTCFH